MKENIIQKKSYEFSIKIIGLYRYLTEEKKEFVLSKQILRSGTSIGANVEEAIGGQSRKDFISKLSIAHKEARETRYWLSLLKDTYFATEKELGIIFDDCEEIIKILSKIQKTVKNNS